MRRKTRGGEPYMIKDAKPGTFHVRNIFKKYKAKNHRGAYPRWRVVGDGYFKRKQAGANHLNVGNRVWKTKAKRKRVLCNAQQRNLLKKLLPYWKKAYMRR
ncbi:hypothetical protein HDV00_005550 [Rhizophlyctis rosea]|nr:hypothetical protein HDV00_005550 [Rhizophlyctis rosea]